MKGRYFKSFACLNLLKPSLNLLTVLLLQVSDSPLLRRLEEGSLQHLPLTRAVNISHNPSLVYIHPAALQLQTLQSLDISHNQLTSLEDMSANLPGLQNIWVTGNSFVCHCSLHWLQKLLQQHEKVQVGQ